MAPQETHDLSTWDPESHRRPGRTRSETKKIQNIHHPQSSSLSASIQMHKPARKSEKKKDDANKRVKSVGNDAKVTKRTTTTTKKPRNKLPVSQKSLIRALSLKEERPKPTKEPAPAITKKAAKGATQTSKTKTKEKPKSAPKASARSTREVTARISKERSPRPRKPWERSPTDYRGTAKETAPGVGSWFTGETPARLASLKAKDELKKEEAIARKKHAAEQAAAARKKEIAEQEAAKRVIESCSPTALSKRGKASGTGSLLQSDGPSTNGLKHLSATNGEWLGPRHREKIERYRNLSPEQRKEVDALWDKIIFTSITEGDKTLEEITQAVGEHMLAFVTHGIDQYNERGSERWMKRARTSLVTCAAREKEGAIYVEPKGR